MGLAIAREQLAAAQVAQSGETGWPSADRLYPIHVSCTDTWTLLHLDNRAGKTAMEPPASPPIFAADAVRDGLVATGGTSWPRIGCAPPITCRGWPRWPS